MLDRLIESGARATARRHLVRSGLIAVVAHAVIVAGAVWATLVLRAAGIEGRVVLQVVIDTLGRAERAAAVVESSNRGFDAAALAYVRGALFRPGRVRGRAVRVLIRLPIAFTLQGAR